MKRFWLLLLAFVLPLQMSWAAVHGCDDEAGAAAMAMVSHAEPGQHVLAVADEVSNKTEAQQGDFVTDASCGAAHGCHGLHHPIGQAELLVVFDSGLAVLCATDTRQAQRCFGTRHERPQWFVA